MKISLREIIIWAAVFLGLLLFSTAVLSQETVQKTATGAERFVSFGVHQASLADVDAKDALAAFNVWVNEITLERGYSTKAHLFENTDDLERAMRNGVIQLANASTLAFFRLSKTGDAIPILGELVGGNLGRKFIILVRTDGPITDLAGLKGRRIFVRARDDLAMLFLNTVLLKAMASEAGEVFSSIQEKRKYSQAAMGVFFKQADACLVSDDFFRTMIELNPQVRRDLRIIAESPRLIDKVTFVSPKLGKELTDLFIEESQKIGQTERGRQLLLLFSVDDISFIQESQLDGAKSLLNEYEGLKLKLSRSSGSGGGIKR